MATIEIKSKEGGMHYTCTEEYAKEIKDYIFDGMKKRREEKLKAEKLHEELYE